MLSSSEMVIEISQTLEGTENKSYEVAILYVYIFISPERLFLSVNNLKTNIYLHLRMWLIHS